jgi:hypothetical protein
MIMLAILTVIGCKKENTIEPIPSGAFQYNAYDTSGALLINGWFTLIIQDSTHIRGEWHFKKMNPPQKSAGPQFGDGQLSGSFQGTNLSINLNPTYVDNNVFLSGPLTSHEYIGSWNWVSFIGRTGGGHFEAHRQ